MNIQQLQQRLNSAPVIGGDADGLRAPTDRWRFTYPKPVNPVEVFHIPRSGELPEAHTWEYVDYEMERFQIRCGNYRFRLPVFCERFREFPDASTVISRLFLESRN